MSDKQSDDANTRLSGPWLLLARAVLLALFALNVIIYIVGTPVYFAQIFPSNHACFQDCLSSANLQTLHELGISITTYAIYWTAINLLFALTYFAVATLIFWRRSNDWMALLASFFLVALGGSFTEIPAALAAVHPAWRVLVTPLSEGVIGFPSLVIFLSLFPGGRFVPRWTRWIVIAFAALFIPGSFFPNTLLNVSNWPIPLFLPLPLLIFGSLVYTQVYRYRHISTLVERQQTKWVVLGTTTALVGFVLIGVVPPQLIRLGLPLQSLNELPYTILVTGIYLLLLLIPLSIALALLRYRLVRCPLGQGVINFPALFDILASACPDVTMSIELGALEARHIRVLADDYWSAYPPRSAAQLASVLRFVQAHARPIDEDWRTPYERGEPVEAIVAYEEGQLAESVAYIHSIWPR